MAISFVNKGTFASGSTSGITPGLPASMQSGDLCLLFVESLASQTPSISANGSIGTWTQVTNSPVSNGLGAVALSVKLTVWYGWWTSGTTAPTVGISSGNHITAIIMAFRGVDSTTPFDATPVALNTETTARTTVTPPAITTVTDGAMVVYGIGLDADANSTNALSTNGANANLTEYTVRHEQTVSTGLGGGIAVITGIKETAGSSGSFGTAPVSASCTHVYLTIALRPQSTFNITVTVPTESTITITEGSGTTVTATADASITIPTESTITISEINGTTITVISNATIIVPNELTIAVNNDNPTVKIIANITITVPTASSITINEGVGTIVTVSADTTIIISTGSSIQLSNDNPLIEAVRMLMTISPTSQLQVYNLFIEGAECSLTPDGTLTMIEFIEGAIVDFNSTGTLTAFEFIEGGM